MYYRKIYQWINARKVIYNALIDVVSLLYELVSVK